MERVAHTRRHAGGGSWSSIAGLAVRIAVALPGSYGLAVATAFLVARALPASRVEAATIASLTAFLAIPAAAIWAFAAASAWRALAGVAGPALLFGVLAWLLGPRP